MICHDFTHNLINKGQETYVLSQHSSGKTALGHLVKVIWSFSISETRLFAHYIYKYKYLYYSGGFDSIRFRF